ncbi:MAG: ATP-dependent zinc metalloprotease FtsH, partial [Acidimicrobiales bacterium]
ATLPPKTGEAVTFSDFDRKLRAGEIESVTLLDFDSLAIFRSGGRTYRTPLPKNNLTVDRLLAEIGVADVNVEVDQQRLKGLVLPATYLIPGLLFVSIIFFVHLLNRSSGGAGGFLRAGDRRVGPERPFTFADVAGLDEAVAELREVRDYLTDPGRFQAMGAEPPRGILLVGPPGTGKTLLARAVAGEAGVPYFSMSGTEFVEAWVGVGAARVRDLFRQLRQSAPAILFIDELDAVGRARTGAAASGNDEYDQTLNQLLVEMDGFDRVSGVVHMAATNRPDVLDPAILRRGRFDRQIVVDIPDRAGRLAILGVHARGKPLDATVDLAAVAAQTPGLCGADLASALNEAALLAARRGAGAIGAKDIDDAVDRIVAGNERRSHVLTPEERRAVAYHEAGHAVVAWALPGTDPVTKISVVSRGQALGRTWMVPDEERSLITKGELLARIAVYMGGVAAEELVLGESTTGPHDDLRQATRLARRMVCEYGMSEALGRMALGERVSSAYLGGDAHYADYSPEVAARIDGEIRRTTDHAFALATEALTVNAATFERLAAALIERETIGGADLVPFSASVAPPALGRAQGRLAVRRIRPAEGK